MELRGIKHRNTLSAAIEIETEFANMDPFQSLSFTAALPGTFTFIEGRQSAEPTFLHASTLRDIQTSPEQLGVAEMKRQQWESLKPLIQRVYIEEDKSFLDVADMLRDEHGFEPT
jgi:hypothetical protein